MASFFVTAWSECYLYQKCEQVFQNRSVMCRVGDTLFRDFQDGFNSCIPPTPASHRPCPLPYNCTDATTGVKMPVSATCINNKCSILKVQNNITNCCEYNAWALVIVCVVAIFAASALSFFIYEITIQRAQRRVYEKRKREHRRKHIEYRFRG